jgi:signal transduction histidine kinase/CheY-like chemotaxis protein
MNDARMKLFEKLSGMANGIQIANRFLLTNAAVALSLVAALWAAVIFDARRTEQVAISQAKINSENLALVFREDVERTLSGVDQIMVMMIEENNEIGAEFRIPKWIANSPFLNGITRGVTLVGPDGDVMATSTGYKLHVDVSDREYFRHHLDPSSPQPYIGTPIMGRVSGKLDVQMSRRITRKDGSFGGVLVVSLDPAYFSRFFETLEHGQNGVIDVVGRDGIVRFRRAPDGGKIGQNLKDTPLFQQMLTSNAGSQIFRSHLDGVERIYSYQWVPDLPIGVVVGLAMQDVLAPNVRQWNNRLAIGGGMTIVILVLFSIMARQAMRGRERELAAHTADVVREQRALLEKAVNNIRPGLLMCDKNDRVVVLNKSFVEMYNLSAVRGDSGDSGTFIGDIDSFIGKQILGSDRDLEKVVDLADGRSIRIVNRLLDDGGWVSVHEDITERKAMEDQLRHSQKMEAIGSLTGGVAHDFNNLLTAITSTLDLLAEGVADNPELASIVRLISDAADRGAELTSQLLSFARKQPLQPRKTDLNALLMDVARLLRPTLGETVEVETILSSEDCTATVDPTLLNSALVNLAINARDAMPNGGKLKLETRNVVLSESEAPMNVNALPGEYVVISVSDTGSGIPKSIIDKIFEPFFTTKDVGKGTGLGLSMVYGFVKQSGGHIKVYSEEGHGTTFRIYLPQASAPAASIAVAPSAVEMEGGTETILVVEDDAMVRTSVITQIQSLGYTTLSAANAAEALAIADGGASFDLLFTDMIMPGNMNGRQLADEMARRRSPLQVLFTSGYTEDAVIHHGRLDPGLLLLAKPFRKIELAQMLRTAIEAAAPYHIQELSLRRFG